MKRLITALTAITLTGIVGVLTVFGINAFVINSTKEYIDNQNIDDSDFDCIFILGCGVDGDQPSMMLIDRLDTGIELYKKGYAPKIIMSGDHGREEYDEVNVMKDYAIKAGVPSEDIFMDHAGFSTYESMYRAKEIFRVKKMIVVTQEYHLPRAIYNAKSFNIETYGKSADGRRYAGQIYRDIREILARNKDFIYTIIKPEPTYLGEALPVWGNGNITNDK